jgi:beta-glucuronidase
VITEFGADAKAGHRGTVDEKGTEDCQLDIYQKQVAVLGKIPYVKGTSPWILYDFRCPRRLHPITQNYYNTKGLLSEDKSYKKPAFYVMQDFYKNK